MEQERKDIGKELDRFRTKVQAFEDRVSLLHRSAEEASGAGELTCREVLEELRASIEELHVAEEELRVQNEELLSTYEDLETQRHRYRELFDFAPDAYLTTDEFGVIREANRAACEMLGLNDSLLVKKTFLTFLQGPDRSDFRARLYDIKQMGRLGNWDLTLWPRKGGPLPVAASVVVVHKGESGPIELRWLIRDVSERKKAEDELARYRDRLEVLVGERTRELAQEVAEHRKARDELQKARDELEQRVRERTAELTRSNDELQQFAYVASHDLQEPLRMVASYVRLLEMNFRDKLDQDGRDFVDFAVEGAVRMQSLINDLLAFSRVESQGKPFEPVALEGVLAEVLDNLELTIEETGSKVTHDPLPTVVGDRTQLMQVFQNLIGNAIKFRGKNASEVHVGACRNGDRWLLTVTDNGIGIEARHFERIFHIFQRLHTRKEYPGTGIGLAVVKRIVERHGGSIWLDSTPGKGTTFYLTIPAEASDKSNESAASEANEQE